MTYSTLLSLEKAINQILDHDRFSISHHEKKLIISLDKYVGFFQVFIEDFPEKSKILETRIRDVATEAEDIIEWFSWKQIRNNTRCIKRFSVLRRIKFKYQLQKVKDEMDSAATKVVEIQHGIIISDKQVAQPDVATSSSQVADIGEINMVGFEEDLLEIKEKLCGPAPQLQVLPIFGMGGIGKTTLARNAYDAQLIAEYFQIRAWVTVSQDYSERRMLLDLLDPMKKFDPESMKENSGHGNESPTKTREMSNSEMALKVHKILIGRRFLIVMDDVWSTKVLDDVKKLSPNDNNGSRIMLTTRLTEIATYASSYTLFHEMHLMDLDQSWNLLQERVLIHQGRIPRELESIGKEIARSCGGLPLAVVVIAGVLATVSKTLTSWEEVAKNIGSSLATINGQIEKILSLSYDHLPHHLRPCFLYMGGFPKYHEIEVTTLTRLWIAESFVKPAAGKEFEDTAEEYLEDLVDKSLVIVTERKSNGRIRFCILHDMVREMCIRLSLDEKVLVHVNGRQALKLLKGMKDQRRLSISHSDLNLCSNLCSPTIRTILYFQDEICSFESLRLLRVLDMQTIDFGSNLLPDEFFELFHLRYLALRYFHQISRDISNLQSLQTLIFNGHADLPYEIWNMPQLRHLIFFKSPLLYLNGTTSSLENLQTLGEVQNFTCSISNLNKIPNLRKLRLIYFQGSRELLFHNFVHLRQLENLHLELGRYGLTNCGKPNLVVPSSLKKLTLVGWGYVKPYLDIVGPFPNLEVLKLKSFNFMPQVWRTTDGDFPRLKFLLIENSNIRQWDTESSHFPRLKALHIHSCRGLTEVPECIGEIPTLELIELKVCTVSLANSAKQIQEEAQSYGDDILQVRCIDCKDI